MLGGWPSLTEAQLEGMRLLHATMTEEEAHRNARDMAAFFRDCSDVALRQVAEGGIRFVSLAAIMAAWRRGLRVNVETFPIRVGTN